MSATELAALNSGAVTSGAQAAANAKSAIGNAVAAEGGGNTGVIAGVTTNAQTAAQVGVAENTSNELNKIQQENYNLGRENYTNAIRGAEAAPGMFGPSTSAEGVVNQAWEGASNTANQIAQENQSWVGAVTGALGGIAGAATGGLMKNMAQPAANSNTSTPNAAPIQPFGSGEDYSDNGGDSYGYGYAP